MKIRKARKSDLEVLNKKLFVESIPNLHEQKLNEQEKREGFWLIAWKGEVPVGHIQLRIKKLREKSCAHMETLGVKEKYRKKGIATRLIGFTEDLAKKKGFKKIGFAVEKENNFLKTIYKRKGYEDWKKGVVIEKWKENKKEIKEECNYLVKNLI